MQNRERLIDGGQTDNVGVEVGGGGIEQKGKRTQGHGKQCGDWGGEGSIKGKNDHGKIQ